MKQTFFAVALLTTLSYGVSIQPLSNAQRRRITIAAQDESFDPEDLYYSEDPSNYLPEAPNYDPSDDYQTGPGYEPSVDYPPSNGYDILNYQPTSYENGGVGSAPGNGSEDSAPFQDPSEDYPPWDGYDPSDDYPTWYENGGVWSAPGNGSEDSAPPSLLYAMPPTGGEEIKDIFQNGFTWPVQPEDFKLKGQMRRQYLDNKKWRSRCEQRQKEFQKMGDSLVSLYRIATNKKLWTLPKKTRPSDSDLWYETASMICTACEKRWLNATYDKGNHGPRWIVHKFLHFIDPREVSDEETESYYNDLIENK